MNVENVILSAFMCLERGLTCYLLSLYSVKSSNKQMRPKNNEDNNSIGKMSSEDDVYKKVGEKFRKLMEVIFI